MLARAQTSREQIALMLGGLGLAALVVVAGCGGEAGDPRRELSGQVTHAGKPVPSGRIVFSPDASQGNNGPATIADIERGHYRTRPGKGVIAGPHVVTIMGTDGTMATESNDASLFPPYQTHVTVRSDDASYDFVVP